MLSVEFSGSHEEVPDSELWVREEKVFAIFIISLQVFSRQCHGLRTLLEMSCRTPPPKISNMGYLKVEGLRLEEIIFKHSQRPELRYF